MLIGIVSGWTKIMKTINVKFKVEGQPEVSLALCSKFTVIVGKDSGEGKSEFISALLDAKVSSKLNIQCEYPVAISLTSTLDDIMDTTVRKVIVVDEPNTINIKMIEKMELSNHLFILICRGLPKRILCSYYGLYTLHREQDWFSIEKFNTLNISRKPRKPDVIITEAEDNHSENELIKAHTSINVLAAGGSGKFKKAYSGVKDKKVLLLVDLGNILSIYRILKKYCNNAEIYDYQCFEELLCECQLVKNNANKVVLDPINFKTLEKYYEALANAMTKGTKLEYQHGKPLACDFLEEKNFDAIFNNSIGSGLHKILKSRHLKSIDFGGEI